MIRRCIADVGRWREGGTFAADTARNLPGAFVPAQPDGGDEAVQETHHVLRGTQSRGVLLQTKKTIIFLVNQIPYGADLFYDSKHLVDTPIDDCLKVTLVKSAIVRT